jgi:hypothetical protein
LIYKHLKYLKYSIKALYLVSLLFSYSLAKTQNIPSDTLSRIGYAYAKDDTNKLVFVEKSRFLIKDKEIVWSSSKFMVEGEEVATKLYTFKNGNVNYVYQFKDGYNETALKNGNVYDCYVTEKHGETASKKSIENENLLRIDEGVISTILKNKGTLDTGERVPIKIMVVERGDYFEFFLELEEKINSTTATYTLFPNNFLLRAFVPDFFFTLQNGQLKKVIGMSKVGRQLGESEVFIKFK